MLKSERQDSIARLVDERGTVSVREVSDLLSVSEMTIRRDLEELSSAGRVVRVHGGARRMSSARGLSVPREFSHAEKQQIHRTEKLHIARIAASVIDEGDTVFLGVGTTIEDIARILPAMRLRVITNSLPVFNLLEDRNDFDLWLVGGMYRPRTGAFVGPIAETAVSSLGIDKAFIGANGILDGSISTSNTEEGSIQALVFDKADSRYLVADSSKLGRRDFYCFYDLADLDALITDNLITAEQRDALREHVSVLS